MRKSVRAVVVAALAILVSSVFFYSAFGSGTLEIKITDPPKWGQATHVYIFYSSIELHRANRDNESGWFTIVDESAWINLTKVLNVNQTIGHKNLPAGLYNTIRFRILDAIVTVGGKNYTATVPSGMLQIVVTKGGLRITTGQKATILIDVETKITGSYKIVPDVRVLPS